MIKAAGAYDAGNLLKHGAGIRHESQRVGMIDDIESCFLEAGKITHVALSGSNVNAVMCGGFLISLQLIFGEIKHRRLGPE